MLSPPYNEVTTPIPSKHSDFSASRHTNFMGFTLFLAYLAVALPLPVISLYTADSLQLGATWGGLAVGSAFISTIATRKWAGSMVDKHGGKRITMQGLVVYILANALCLLAVLLTHTLPAVQVYLVLLAGRFLLGVGESYAMVGIISWSIGLAGPEHAGKVITIVGMAIYGAIAASAPLGLFIYTTYGLHAVFALALVLPLVGFVLLRNTPDATRPKTDAPKESFFNTLRRIWPFGCIVGLQGIGFAVLSAFVSFYFVRSGWPYAGLGLTCFGVGFVGMRIMCGNLPDRLGGLTVGAVCLAIEGTGQFLLWSAPNVWVALAGALLTGVGCSMVYPSMGVEVVRRVPANVRGTALGGFAMFQDLAYATSGPLAGLCIDNFGIHTVFLLGGVAALVGLLMTGWQIRSGGSLV